MEYSRLKKTPLNLSDLKTLYPSLSASEVIKFMDRRKLGTKDHSRFAEILELCIQNNEKARIVYAAAEDGFVEEARIVNPLAFQVKKPIKENQEFIYLVAYNSEKVSNSIRTYRFDRFTEVSRYYKPAEYNGDYTDYYTYNADDIVPDYYNPQSELPNFSKDLL